MDLLAELKISLQSDRYVEIEMELIILSIGGALVGVLFQLLELIAIVRSG